MEIYLEEILNLNENLYLDEILCLNKNLYLDENLFKDEFLTKI